MNLNNKVIWITGASSGLGKGLAITLSKKYDCKLILSSRRKEALEVVKSQCQNPQNIAVIPLDLGHYNTMEVNVQEAISTFGTVDVLINNGGVSQRSLIMDTSIEVDKKLMEIDYLGTIALSKALLPHFIEKQSGHFVTVTSLMGKFSSPYRSAYCGAKHALHGFFDALRMEHQKDRINVTLICPGFVNTNVARNALTGDGSQQNTQDKATENGLSVDVFVARMIKAIKKEKFEAYIGQKEVLGVYLKRFFPKLLHQFVIKSQVR
ncbi:short-chain dehydrogenase [Mangrovimonas yunxiaonensis]|uniref:Short-chain dehydrogenase n=1 Tax=Mangrovimonas yunxiaonensis TaxID=1197477 RepID=A0A084THB7_9FLAO|nr:SDR family oxidoreductase [Mangrovimonas yunxiaonensis]KFB00103.1 short-chain dehydrogenase [Mangrovimonas yunxiaonensis]GGH41892.1 oxidoreductase [Mangrovimonas yunxiaonensis]